MNYLFELDAETGKPVESFGVGGARGSAREPGYRSEEGRRWR